MDKAHFAGMGNGQGETGGALSLSRAMSVVGNIDFLPSMWESGFRHWAAKGLSTTNQLFEGSELKSFAQLQNQFTLPPNDLFQYLQIRHYIKNHTEWERIKREPTTTAAIVNKLVDEIY